MHMGLQVILAAVAAFASLLGVAYALASIPASHRGERWRALKSVGLSGLPGLVVFWVILLFAATLPKSGPFLAGMRLGWGFLIGGALAVYALFESLGSFEGENWARRTTGVISAACLGPSLVLIIFRGYPNDALAGCALAALLMAGLAGAVSRPIWAAAHPDAREPLAFHRATDVYALASVAVFAAVRLALGHFPRAIPTSVAGGYWSFPLALVAGGSLAVAFLGTDWRGPRRRWWLLGTGSMAAVIMALLALAADARLLPGLGLMMTLAGLVGFTLIAAVLIDAEDRAGEGTSWRPVTPAFASLFLTLALVGITFRQFHGYGEALALCVALPIVAVLYLGADRRREPVAESLAAGALALLALFVLFRVFMETVGRTRGLDFQTHYDVFAVTLGAAASFGVLAFASRGIDLAVRARKGGRSGAGSLMARTILLGLILTATPLVIGAVWGAQSVAAFLVGLVIADAIWVLVAAWCTGVDRQRVLASPPHVLLFGMAVVAAQFGPRIVGLELTRAAKLLVIGLLALTAIVWVVVEGRPVEKEEVAR